MQIAKSEISTEDPKPPQAAPVRFLPRSVFVLLALIGFLVILTLLVYRLSLTNPLTRTVVSILPFPAVLVNGTMISMRDYIDEHNALLQYMESTGNEELPSDEIVRQTILDALINKAVIRELALRTGIKLDQERVEQYYLDVVQNQQSEEVFTKELNETFGWTREQFKKRIIESIVLALQMSEYVLANAEWQAEARTQIEQELTAPGSVPEKDLGDVAVLNLPSQWADVAQLPVGQRSGILESEREYVIVKVEERKEETSEVQLHLKAAIVPKKTLEDVVKEYLAKAAIRYFI